MPLSIVDGFPTTGYLERVLVFELDLNAPASQPQHEPRALRGLRVQHDSLGVKRAEVELCCKPDGQTRKSGGKKIPKEIILFVFVTDSSLCVLWQSVTQEHRRKA